MLKKKNKKNIKNESNEKQTVTIDAEDYRIRFKPWQIWTGIGLLLSGSWTAGLFSKGYIVDAIENRQLKECRKIIDFYNKNEVLPQANYLLYKDKWWTALTKYTETGSQKDKYYMIKYGFAFADYIEQYRDNLKKSIGDLTNPIRNDMKTYTEFSDQALKLGNNLMIIPNQILVLMDLPKDVRKKMLYEAKIAMETETRNDNIDTDKIHENKLPQSVNTGDDNE